MKQVTKTILVCGMALICYTGGDTTLFAQTKMINQVDFSQVRIQDDFWSPRLKKHVTKWLQPNFQMDISTLFIPLQGWINVGQIWTSMKCIVQVI